LQLYTYWKKKQTLILDFHHSLVAEIVPISVLQPTPVLKINFFHILQSFFISSHLFFNRALVNVWLICSLKILVANSHHTLMKWVLSLIHFLIVNSKNLACVSHVETLLYNLKVRVEVVYDIFKSFVWDIVWIYNLPN
jgi:hypothetical protein